MSTGDINALGTKLNISEDVMPAAPRDFLAIAPAAEWIYTPEVAASNADNPCASIDVMIPAKTSPDPAVAIPEFGA